MDASGGNGRSPSPNRWPILSARSPAGASRQATWRSGKGRCSGRCSRRCSRHCSRRLPPACCQPADSIRPNLLPHLQSNAPLTAALVQSTAASLASSMVGKIALPRPSRASLRASPHPWFGVAALGTATSFVTTLDLVDPSQPIRLLSLPPKFTRPVSGAASGSMSGAKVPQPSNSRVSYHLKFPRRGLR